MTTGRTRTVTRLARTTAAELIKLRGLPVVVATALTTVATGAILAASATGAAVAADATQAVTRAVPLLQIGPILIGVLIVATEYADGQIATTLTATPNRLMLLAGKTLAYLITATATSVATIGAAWSTHPSRQPDVRPLAGAAVYLVLIGLLALGLSVVLRSLIPPIAGMLTLVLIVSPLLASYTEHARWLPDQAGRLLYHPHADTVLGPATGTLVLLLWTTAAASAAITTFHSRDG